MGNGTVAHNVTRGKTGKGTGVNLRTAEHLQHAEYLRTRHHGELFMSLRISELKHHAKLAGGKGSARKRQEWRNGLRALAPGIGWDDVVTLESRPPLIS